MDLTLILSYPGGKGKPAMTKAGKSYDKGGGGTAEAPEAAAPQHQNFPERAEKRRAFCPALRFHSLDFPAKRTKGSGPGLFLRRVSPENAGREVLGAGLVLVLSAVSW